jgi:O-antigen ligase
MIFPIILALAAAIGAGVAAALWPMVVLIIAGSIAALWIGLYFLEKPLPLLGLLFLTVILGQFGRIPPLSGDILLIDILVGILFVSWLLKVLWGVQRFRFTTFHLLWIAFLGVALVSLLFTTLPLTRLELLQNSLYWVRLVTYSSLMWVIPSMVTKEKTASQVVYWLLWSAGVVAVLGFLQLRIYPDIGALAKYGWDPHVGRLVSTFLDPNYLGGFFALILAFVLGRSLGEKQPFAWGTIFLFLAASVFTYSRSGYLAVGIVVLAFGLRYSWKVLLLAICIAVPLGLQIPRVQQRIEGAFSVDATSQARILSWQNAGIIIGNFPLLGVGYNNYREAQETLGILQGDPQSRAATGSDSSILNIQATTGIFGLGLFLAAGIVLARKAYRLTKTTEKSIRVSAAYGLLFGVPGLLVNALFVNSLFYPLIFFPLMVLVGLMLSGDEEV